MTGTYQTRQQIVPAPIRHQTNLDEALSEAHAHGAEADVTGQREVGAATRRCAVNGGNHRLVHGAQKLNQFARHARTRDYRCDLVARLQLKHVGDVTAGTEGLASTSDHHRADCTVGLGAPQGCEDVLTHAAGQCIHGLRSIEGDGRDARGDLVQDVLFAHKSRFLIFTTTAPVIGCCG